MYNYAERNLLESSLAIVQTRNLLGSSLAIVQTRNLLASSLATVQTRNLLESSLGEHVRGTQHALRSNMLLYGREFTLT